MARKEKILRVWVCFGFDIMENLVGLVLLVYLAACCSLGWVQMPMLLLLYFAASLLESRNGYDGYRYVWIHLLGGSI